MKRAKQIEGCREHFSGRQRIAPCTPGCSIRDEINRFGALNAFCFRLEKYDTAALLNADPAKAAKVFGISEAHAAGYIKLERVQRGLGEGQNGSA